MTTVDNKLSCSSSSSSENLAPNQLLLLQQINNNNMQNCSNKTNASPINDISLINQSNNGKNASPQTTTTNQKILKEGQSSSNSSQHGRWTKEEHQKFLEGLNKYGKNWKKVEDHIGTRTGAQIRSHAQKFFNRLEKEYGKPSNTQAAASSNQGNGSSETPSMHKQSQINDYGTIISAEYAQRLLKSKKLQTTFQNENI